jgi:hypothetical protein
MNTEMRDVPAAVRARTDVARCGRFGDPAFRATSITDRAVMARR